MVTTLSGGNVAGIAEDHPVIADIPSPPSAPEARRRWEELDRPRLSGREREILLLAARGLSNATIAAGLGLSPETVKSHLRQVMGKLGARNRSHAVALAYEFGLLAPGSLWRPGASAGCKGESDRAQRRFSGLQTWSDV